MLATTCGDIKFLYNCKLSNNVCTFMQFRKNFNDQTFVENRDDIIKVG